MGSAMVAGFIAKRDLLFNAGNRLQLHCNVHFGSCHTVSCFRHIKGLSCN
jgi:hypothetical protein